MSITYIQVVGLIVVLVICFVVYYLFKVKGRDNFSGFAWGFGLSFLAALVTLVAYFFKKNARKK